jgi:hypothetical protein
LIEVSADQLKRAVVGPVEAVRAAIVAEKKSSCDGNIR